jgi:acyl carrier protein
MISSTRRSAQPEREVSVASIQERVEAVIRAKFGRVESDLSASGIIDSLRAMELLVELQDEFGVRLSDVTVQDLSTVPRIVVLVEAALRSGDAKGARTE